MAEIRKNVTEEKGKTCGSKRISRDRRKNGKNCGRNKRRSDKGKRVNFVAVRRDYVIKMKKEKKMEMWLKEEIMW